MHELNLISFDIFKALRNTWLYILSYKKQVFISLAYYLLVNTCKCILA